MKVKVSYWKLNEEVIEISDDFLGVTEKDKHGDLSYRALHLSSECVEACTEILVQKYGALEVDTDNVNVYDLDGTVIYEY